VDPLWLKNNYEAFYIGTVELLRKMGFNGQSDCWIIVDPDMASMIVSVVNKNAITIANPISKQDNEFVGLINGVWWLYSCPDMKKNQSGVPMVLIGADIRQDGSAKVIGALEIT
jgi:hypothetical protein